MVGHNRGSFFAACLFRYRSEPGTKIPVWQVHQGEQIGFDIQWFTEGADAVFYLTDRSDGVCILSE